MTRDDAEAMLLDVAPHVHAAVTAFEPPEGYTAYPMPTKNNAQRSLIYSYGRRVQSLQDGKSLWFCLASAQCRANRTTISTVANISGCTRHLQVFHGIVSPKTLTMTKKALVSMESGALESNETDSSGQPHRVRVLDAVRTIVVRNLLPLRAVPVMLDGSPQVDSRVEEADVIHSLLEMFGATQKTIADGIRCELAIAMAPLLHLSLTKSTSSSGDALVLRARFLTEGFEVKDVGLGVKRMEGTNDSMMVVHWIERVLDAYRIKWLNDVATVTVDSELPHASDLEVALSVHFQRPCALTCADLCLSVLACTMGVRDSPMRRLVEAVLAIARFAVSVDSLEEVFEEVAQDILALVRCDSTGRLPWHLIFAVMERAVVGWDEIHNAISTGPTPSCPPVLLTEFTQPELLEAISILHPIQRLLSPSARVDEDTSNETRTTMEALIAITATMAGRTISSMFRNNEYLLTSQLSLETSEPKSR
ncbi:hypothetical protein Poli38472_013506 [Pythium oligandrum]|uniref:Uncharacterized protein n=1 Tax=Pythium oligandrum TaxID=41045 RepID=A0A8K1C8Q9_PYTOL|nr:hypothetical protein Poli38472_013506 [Pythium oligandrum]|eukprot:TMW58032.1 hypothetical protein Poli38472_013506 [Pythium oligandrum]